MIRFQLILSFAFLISSLAGADTAFDKAYRLFSSGQPVNLETAYSDSGLVTRAMTSSDPNDVAVSKSEVVAIHDAVIGTSVTLKIFSPFVVPAYNVVLEPLSNGQIGKVYPDGSALYVRQAVASDKVTYWLILTVDNTGKPIAIWYF